MNKTKTIEWNGAIVTVRRATVRSRLASTFIYGALGADENTPTEEYLYMSYYARYLTQTTVESGELEVPLPATSAPEDELQQGYAAFLDADIGFYDHVIAALNEVDDSNSTTNTDPNA